MVELRKVLLSLVLVFSFLQESFAAGGVVNIFTWYGQIPASLLKQFEQETGIKVNIDFYDSNEILEANLLAGNTGYDVVFPTFWPFAAWQISAGIYHKLDKSKLPNYANIDPTRLSKIENADPGNEYSVPYIWGLVALGYNKEIIERRVPKEHWDSWALLYSPAVIKEVGSCGIAMLEDAMDIFFGYYIYKGYDIKDRSLARLKQVRDELKILRPHIKKFSTSLTAEQLASGDLCMVMHWSEYLVNARNRAEDLAKDMPGKPEVKIILPKEGTLMWIDVMAIPSDSPNVENAHKFIDFMLRAESAAAVTNHANSITAVKTSWPLLRKEIREDKTIFPSDEYMKKVHVAEIRSLQFQRRMSRYFTSIITYKAK